MRVLQLEEQKMKVKIIHLWVPAVISYIFSLFLAFSGEILGTAIVSTVYLVLIISTKWVNDETYR
jgi:hypothetical protein